MKQLIILLAMIVLGVALFSMIAGSNDSSIRNSMEKVWQQERLVKQLKDAEQ